MSAVVFFQAEDGIRDLVRSRGLGDVYKRQVLDYDVTTSADGILATRCLFYQPQAAAIASDGQMLSLIHI